VEVDVVGPRALPRAGGPAAIEPILADAIARHEIVYFDGHADGGRLAALARPGTYAPAGYRILLLDTCWSLQHYGVAARTAGGRALDLLVNPERSVTGSVGSFLPFLIDVAEGAAAQRRGEPALVWARLLAAMNGAAEARAAQRTALGAPRRLRAPERYGLSVGCRQP
jgi:hypothetical protein